MAAAMLRVLSSSSPSVVSSPSAAAVFTTASSSSYSYSYLSYAQPSSLRLLVAGAAHVLRGHGGPTAAAATTAAAEVSLSGPAPATAAAVALDRRNGAAAGGRSLDARGVSSASNGGGSGSSSTTTSRDGLRKSFSETRVVGFPVDIIYSVVSDVDKYHNFVPFCLRSHVVSKTQTSMTADLEIGFGPISERYRSNVTLDPRVSVKAKSENTVLFSHFDSSWHFEPGPVPNTTSLSFHVDFGFRSPLYRQAVDVVFDQVVLRIISAFERRCRSVYGPPVRVDARSAARGKETRIEQRTEKDVDKD